VAKRTASAKKQARAGARRSVRNRAVKSEVKTLIVKARKSLSAGSAESALEAVRALDRAAAKGILHRNNAARRKARLARQLVKIAAVAPAAAAAPAKGKKAAASAAAAKAPAPKKK
jgi:small subunit ribosomal protein S20